MKFQELSLPGAYAIIPDQLLDDRGSFFESFRADAVARATGRPFPVAQINFSVSRRSTIRGIHGVTVPPGQAKYVTCVRGQLLDVLVDLRIGSPAFGRYVSTRLDAVDGVAVHVPAGVGHAFQALTDDACICYVVSTAYVPGTQLDLDPLDPALGLPWDLSQPPVISAKDAAAPTLARALDAGLLPRWEQCRAQDSSPVPPSTLMT